jgi:hypothetical protein
MSVSTELLAVRYVGNASTEDAYVIPFPFFVEEDILAAVSEDGVAPPVNLDASDYAITRAADGQSGTLVTTVAVEPPETIVIYRHMPLVQPTEFQFAGPFPSKSSETALDRLAMQIQQVNRRVNELAGINDGVDYVQPPVGPPEEQRDVKVWADASLRGTVLPQWTGQLGVELSTQSLWIAQSVAVGNWRQYLPHWQLAFMPYAEDEEVPLDEQAHLGLLAQDTTIYRIFVATFGELMGELDVTLFTDPGVVLLGSLPVGAVPVGSLTIPLGWAWAEVVLNPPFTLPKGSRLSAAVVNDTFGTPPANRMGLQVVLECGIG